MKSSLATILVLPGALLADPDPFAPATRTPFSDALHQLSVSSYTPLHHVDGRWSYSPLSRNSLFDISAYISPWAIELRLTFDSEKEEAVRAEIDSMFPDSPDRKIVDEGAGVLILIMPRGEVPLFAGSRRGYEFLALGSFDPPLEFKRKQIGLTKRWSQFR